MSKESQQHYYRFTYLQSEHWHNLRISKLASVNARCNICGHRDLSNDVHHIVYRKLFDVELLDLVVLCRDCHQKVHEILNEFIFIKKISDAKKRWRKTTQRIRFGSRIEIQSMSPMQIVVAAKRLYGEAALISKIEFPKIRKGEILSSFLKNNPNATQQDWETLARLQAA